MFQSEMEYFGDDTLWWCLRRNKLSEWRRKHTETDNRKETYRKRSATTKRN